MISFLPGLLSRSDSVGSSQSDDLTSVRCIGPPFFVLFPHVVSLPLGLIESLTLRIEAPLSSIR
jgi:hypothetical protein